MRSKAKSNRNAKHGVAQSAAPLASSSQYPDPSANMGASQGTWIGEELLQCLNSAGAVVPATRNPGEVADYVETAASQSPSDNAQAMDTQMRTPLSPLLFAHTATHKNMASPTLGGGIMDRVLSLDAYLAASQPPPKSTSSTAPKDIRTQAQAQAPVPRAVGARSSKYTIKLHEMYQALAISQPRFEMNGDEHGWCGKVAFDNLLNTRENEGNGDLVLEEKVFFGTKQEAKERLSEKAVEVLEKLEREGSLVKKPKEKKAKEAAAVRVAEKREREPVINYVGQLLGTHTHSSDAHPPMNYLMYEAH